MAAGTRLVSHREVNSDDEEKYISTFYQCPVQSTSSGSSDGSAPVIKAEQVVGSISQRDPSAGDFLSTPSINGSSSIHTPEPGSMKSVTRLKGASHVNEFSETSPLLSKHDSTSDTATNGGTRIDSCVEEPIYPQTKRKHHPKIWSRCIQCTSLSLMVLVVISVAVIVPVVFKTRPLRNSYSTAVLKNGNDTIIAVKVNSKKTDRISFKLVSEDSYSQPLHVIYLYQRPCNGLVTYSSVVVSSTIIPIDHTLRVILFPTYFVTGSRIKVENFVLNVSANDVDITLYFFNDLNISHATNLDKSVYKAPIYTGGPGVQNTSTIVNYTVPSTGYYFAAIVVSYAYIVAQIDITLHEELFSIKYYKSFCSIENNEECVLSDFSFQDKQECILAHAAYVRDAEWTAANIHVTAQPKRNNITLIVVMSVVGVVCVVLLSVFFVCGFYCLCRNSQKSK